MNLYFNGQRNIFRFDPNLAQEVARDPLNPIVPSRATSLKTNFLVDKVQFGDGYAQIAQSGARTFLLTLDMMFEKRSRPVIEAIRRFLQGEGKGSIYFRTPSEYFWYTPPYPFSSENDPPVKWIVEGMMDINPEEYNAWNLRATFQQVATP